VRPTRVWVFLSVVSLIALLASSAQAQTSKASRPEHLPPPTPTGPPVHRPAVGDSALDILYNQMDFLGTVPTSSQNFSPSAWDIYDDQLADDFVIPTGVKWTITKVGVDGSYSNPVPGSTKGPADSVNVFIYADSGGMPGTSLFSQSNIIPSKGLDTGNFELPLNPSAVLNPGIYWVSVQANENYETNGQWKWLDRTVQTNNGAAWKNPADGFGTGCTTWKRRGVTCNLDPTEPDQIFRINGTLVSNAPTVSSFSPDKGLVGTSVTIIGTTFTGATAVRFNSTSATFTVNSDTKITATVPAGATTGKIAVTTPGGTGTSATDFKVLPLITALNPSSGSVASSVTIVGQSLTDATSVQFNRVPATSFTVVDDSHIAAIVPSGATTGYVGVVTKGGLATSKPIVFSVIPGVSGFTPSHGPPGTIVTITGTTFTGATVVSFNSTSATFTVNSDTKITATVPAGATTGKITVTTPSGTGISTTDFKVPPVVTGFSPPSGPVGATVTLTGTGFTQTTSVKFNGVVATYTVNSDTEIAATVPAGATSGYICVFTPGGHDCTGPDRFKVTPDVISFTPTQGTVGTPVTITGTSFTGATAVTFNGTAAAFTVNSDSQITATVPVGATTGKIAVTTPSGRARRTLSSCEALKRRMTAPGKGVEGDHRSLGADRTGQDPNKGLLHPELAVLFGAFDREGLSWCVLRGETELIAPAGDVDLLVADGDRPRMGRIAQDLGFARVPAWGYGSHAFFLKYEESGGIWIKLDVVTELAFGPGFSLATGAEMDCLAQRQRVQGIPVPADADAFWALLLHRLLDKKGAVGARDAHRLAELAGAVGGDGPLVRFVDSVCPPGWSAERMVGEVERGNWNGLAQLAPSLVAVWRQRRRTDVSRRMIANSLRGWLGKWLGLSRRRGLGVALLGPDGAGKSTLASEIERSFYFPVRSVYMGLYQNHSERRGGMGIPGVRLAAHLATQGTRWVRGAYYRRRGRLVLFDRYSYDAMLPARNPQSRRIRLHRWLLARSCPPPDLVVLLDAPGEVLYARKGEHNTALLERQREAYRALVSRLPNAFVVDASRDPGRIRAEVTAVIWREYVRRWNRSR
jgi:thymidylate kinase